MTPNKLEYIFDEIKENCENAFIIVKCKELNIKALVNDFNTYNDFILYLESNIKIYDNKDIILYKFQFTNPENIILSIAYYRNDSIKLEKNSNNIHNHKINEINSDAIIGFKF